MACDNISSSASHSVTLSTCLPDCCRSFPTTSASSTQRDDAAGAPAAPSSMEPQYPAAQQGLQSPATPWPLPIVHSEPPGQRQFSLGHCRNAMSCSFPLQWRPCRLRERYSRGAAAEATAPASGGVRHHLFHLLCHLSRNLHSFGRVPQLARLLNQSRTVQHTPFSHSHFTRHR
jgi:hypothetical protein